LNRGEVRRSQAAEPGFRPGWDLAGTVERAAPDGTGPQEGARVVGLLGAGAWSERAAVPVNALAELPEGVSFEQAATLPVAGLTALYALEKGDGLLGRNVLVTGASGGVGLFALGLASLGGARPVALVRREENAPLAREAGAAEVAVGEGASAAREHGPFDLILDSLGGRPSGRGDGHDLAAGHLRGLRPDGGAESTFDVSRFYLSGGASLYGFILFHEVLGKPASDGLGRLARLVADGRLEPRISIEEPWTEVGAVAQRLLDRAYPGKAVLRVER
jgi:NADPH:quinone reductase-like Zn-dependent oxidoreductase